MKNKNYLMLAFIAAAAFVTPMKASALSISDYMKQNGNQKTASYEAAMKQAILAAYDTKDSAILAKYGSADKYGQTVEHYFMDVPKGGVQPLAFIAFQAELATLLKDPQTTSNDKAANQLTSLDPAKNQNQTVASSNRTVSYSSNLDDKKTTNSILNDHFTASAQTNTSLASLANAQTTLTQPRLVQTNKLGVA